MKANEAPEKIYFTTNENGTHYYTEGIPFERKYIEYTSTDAFIEKALDKLKQLMYDQHLFEGRMHQDAIIENFIGYFKNYMKGK